MKWKVEMNYAVNSLNWGLNTVGDWNADKLKAFYMERIVLINWDISVYRVSRFYCILPFIRLHVDGLSRLAEFQSRRAGAPAKPGQLFACKACSRDILARREKVWRRSIDASLLGNRVIAGYIIHVEMVSARRDEIFTGKCQLNSDCRGNSFHVKRP